MRPPKLNALSAFDAAARHLNFRRAAVELHLTQGAVAQQVRKLEADLGLPLFHRLARGLALTEQGRLYHHDISRALAIIDRATQTLLATSALITLSVPPSLATKWLVPQLAKFAQLYPEIEIQTLASVDLADFHRDGVDIAIRQTQPPFAEDLVAHVLAPQQLCAVCSPALAQSIGNIQGLQDLIGQRLIQDSHQHWQILLEQASIELPKRILQFNQTALAIDAAAMGQGIALAPKLLLETELTQGKLVIIWQDKRPEQPGFYIVYPLARKANAKARGCVIQYLRAASKPLHG